MNKSKHQTRIIKTIETIVLTILVLSFLVLIYCVYVAIKTENASNDNDYQAEEMSANIEINSMSNNDSEDIVERTSKTVVGISTIKDKGNTIFLKDGTTSLNLGTGFIVSENGYIVTNEHVSGDKFSICYVTLVDGRSYTGNVIWADKNIDLSIIKIDANKLEYVTLGNSDNLKVAQQVYAIGNPVGYEFQRTVTYGIISGLNRTVKITENDNSSYMEDLIQTDATINPGNSGGPLINLSGEVIGVNSVKITNAEGIGFAYPINVIKPIINALKEGNEYVTPTLGVFAYDRNVIPYINQELGLSKSLENGIYVASVVNNSPANNAGIVEGDILLNIDNMTLNKMSDLREYVYSKKPGDTVKIKYMRSGKTIEVDVILAKA